jgi:pyruvate dehydrogenase E2 component (dihydrolipoamide acetyltransferase)
LQLAADAGIPLAALAAQGTGPGGRIIAADVRELQARGGVAASAAAPAAGAAAPGGEFTDVAHSQMRRVIAQRLTASKQSVPHYYLVADVQLDALLALRSKLNGDLPAESRLSVNDFLIKASALALRKVPEVNSSWLEHAIRAYDYVDISVAVAVPDGLVTPVVRDADAKGLVAIGSTVRSLAERARAKKLKPEDYAGGTFTISNLGMFGVRQFSAIINPPQAAILAVGAAERRLVPDATPGAALPYRPATVLSATLSCDHRVVDGAVGAQWLAAFKGYLEDPATMLL